MKNLLLLITLLYGIKLSAQEDYKIRINDSVFTVSLDKKYEPVIDGKKISFSIHQNDTLSYNDEYFNFLYLKDFKISKVQIEKAVEQLVLLTADGDGILIQKYLTMNPSIMNDILLTEMTKESISYGYIMQKDIYKRTLKSGHAIDVTRAILKYKESTKSYEIASIGKKDQGIVIITIVDSDSKSKLGPQIINLLWNSLMFK